MNLIASQKFKNNLKSLTSLEFKKLDEIYFEITMANSISEINSTPLIGFPYLHTIEFGKYVVGIQVKNNEVELAGIVEKGKEMGLFF